MRWLVTNDDGVDALGIRALAEVAARLGSPTVVAPAGALSGCSHRVSSDESFCVMSRDSQTHVVHGTPADCVRVGLYALAKDADWVLSGINHGGNLGVDVLHSGTVAAVREGVLHGKPGSPCRTSASGPYRGSTIRNSIGRASSIGSYRSCAILFAARGSPARSGTSISPTFPPRRNVRKRCSAPSNARLSRWSTVARATSGAIRGRTRTARASPQRCRSLLQRAHRGDVAQRVLNSTCSVRRQLFRLGPVVGRLG